MARRTGSEPALRISRSGFSVHVLHGDVVSGAVLAEFVDCDDVRMIQRRGGVRFALETAEAFVVGGKFGGENFDGGAAAKLGIAREVNFTHSARAQQADDFVGT